MTWARASAVGSHATANATDRFDLLGNWRTQMDANLPQLTAGPIFGEVELRGIGATGPDFRETFIGIAVQPRTPPPAIADNRPGDVTNFHRDWLLWRKCTAWFVASAAGNPVVRCELSQRTMRKISRLDETLWIYFHTPNATATFEVDFSFYLSTLVRLP